MAWTLDNPYCSLADLKAALRITDTNDDDRLTLAINAASRQIENYTHRRFYLDGSVSARLYVPMTPFLVEFDDVQSTSGFVVKTDPNGDGTFPITWDATDYQLEPVNEKMDGQPWVYSKVRAVRNKVFPVYGGLGFPIPNVQATVQVTAKWGWSTIPDEVSQACAIQASMVFKMADVPLGGTPFAETGISTVQAGLHPAAAALLGDYDSTSVLVG